MTFDWDNIKYYFQIPVEWFKSIHDRVFKAFGTNFIVVKEDTDSGGMWIDVDPDAFAQAVRGIATGSVTSVDGVAPDSTGNVPLGAVRSIDDHAPDQDGNIDLDWVVKSVNDETPDANGNVDVDVGVLTVNNTAPDANGNVTISTDISTCLKQSDWMNTSSNYSVCPFNYANAVFTGTVTSAITDLYSRIGAFSYSDLDSFISALGYVNDEDLGDLAYLDNVTVDGHASDASGAVSFGLTGSQWVKTDASGHLTTTSDEVISVPSQYTPVDVANKKVVTGVTWDGTNLKYSSENWTFKNGVLVRRTTNTDTTIDTPTKVTWK